MITKNFKVLLFVGLIAAIAVPITGMEFATAVPNENANDKAKEMTQKHQISKPVDSVAKKAVHQKAMALVADKAATYQEGAALKAKYDAQGIAGLTAADIQKLDEITAEMKDLNLEMDKINAEARALITLTPGEKQKLIKAVGIIVESNIPYTAAFDDQNAEALAIAFETEELGEQYASTLEDLLDVNFYILVEPKAQAVGCSSQNSDCDPLLGGVEITADFGTNDHVTCSYSTAADRDVWWWTDYGFLTAAHCFNDDASGNDVTQPNHNSGKIGDLNIWDWDRSNADCDCAFVKKSGSEQHWKAAYEGANDSLTFAGFSDPSVNDYVILVGQTSGIKTVQVESVTASVTYNSLDDTPISHTNTNHIRVDDWGIQAGDSGGTLHASGSNPDYHGIIVANNQVTGSDGKTYASKWSKIDASFDLND